MERKVGETFKFNGKKVIGKISNSCNGCEMKCYVNGLHGSYLAGRRSICGECCSDHRKDGNSVIFEKVQ